MQMGIQKIAFWNPSCSKVSYSSNTDGKGVDDKAPFGSDLGDDPDEGELAELSCELGMLEGKVCSIPYAIYDLPDLRDILSLDTWNSCLTDEDRFLLSAYLPDMDQHTFIVTMKELFDGSDIYFGNPLDTFFKRLKAGFYPPKVACFREGLMCLQKRKYYHSLRSYHNMMVQVFKDMRWIWGGCEKYHGVEERISMWKKRRNQRAITFLDLNQYPKDDLMTRDEVKLDSGLILVDSQKSADDILLSLSANRRKIISPTVNAKQFQKMKAPVIEPFQNHSPKTVASDAPKQYRPVPKGLLKIAPKPSVQLQRAEMGPEWSLPTFMTMNQSLRDFSLSSLPSHVQNSGGLCEPPFLKLKLDGSRVDSPISPPLSVLNQRQSMTRISGNMESFTRRSEGQMVPYLDGISVSGKRKMFGNAIGDVGRGPAKVFMPSSYLTGAGSYTFGGHNLLPNLGIGTQDISLRSLESKPLGLQCQEGNQCIAKMKEDQLITMYPRISEVLQRTSDAGASKQKTWITPSLDKMKDESHAGDRRSGTILTESNVSARLKDEPVLPLTYKRRKALSKLKSSDFGKTLTLGADLNPAILKESNQDLVMVQKQCIKNSQGGQT